MDKGQNYYEDLSKSRQEFNPASRKDFRSTGYQARGRPIDAAKPTADGNEPAARSGGFEAVMKECLDPLYNYAYRLTGSLERAEDLVQESFARFIEHKSRYPNYSQSRPILFRILHNLFIDQLRVDRRGPMVVSVEDIEGQWDFPSLSQNNSGGPLETLIKNSLSEEVESALGKLDPAFREVIWLREIEGFSYEEISEITETPIGTVRSRLARARRNLARCLEDYARRRGFVGKPSGKGSGKTT